MEQTNRMFTFAYMPKMKYKFNPKTLAYEEVSLSVWQRVFRFLLIISPSIIFGLILTFFFTKQFNSPKEARLKAELDKTKTELDRIKLDVIDANRVLDVLEKKDRDLYRQALYAEEFPEEYRMMGTGGSEKYNYLMSLSAGELLKSISEDVDRLEQRLYGQSLSFNELLKLAKNKEQLLAAVPAIQPVRNTDLKKMASGFGWRIDPIYKTRKKHAGMDFTADKGTEVYVTGDGTVESLEKKRWGYGFCIVVNHGYGYKTRYAHLSKFNVKQGQKVKRGDLIGFVGSTGKSTGPHLHYEVEKNGKKVNPIGYYHSDLTPEQYEKVLELSQKSYKAYD